MIVTFLIVLYPVIEIVGQCSISTQSYPLIRGSHFAKSPKHTIHFQPFSISQNLPSFYTAKLHLRPYYLLQITMPTSTIAFHSSLSLPSSSSSVPSNSEDRNNNISLTSKPNNKSLLHDHPLYTQTHSNLSLQFKEKVLCLEIMGVDSGKALSQNPILHSASLDSIHQIIIFLESKGIHQKDMGRIFGMCPKVLTSDIKTELNPVFKFISYDLKVPENSFRRVINKCPRLLISSVKDQLKPALFYLQRLGFKDLTTLAYQDPILLVSSVEKTLIPKLDYLMSLGYSKGDAIGMVLRCPSLFTFSIENNFKPKIEYFVKEMEGDLEELKCFPQYFSFSLENRIKVRHSESLEKGVKIPVASMLKATDEEFAQLMKQTTGQEEEKLNK